MVLGGCVVEVAAVVLEVVVVGVCGCDYVGVGGDWSRLGIFSSAAHEPISQVSYFAPFAVIKKAFLAV